MRRYDARGQSWDGMQLKGTEGYYCDLRIDPKSVPNQFNMYELADGDSDGTPCRYSKNILVNFYGTFITTKELEIDPKDNCGYNSPDEYQFHDHGLEMKEIMELENTKDGLFAKINIREEIKNDRSIAYM